MSIRSSIPRFQGYVGTERGFDLFVCFRVTFQYAFANSEAFHTVILRLDYRLGEILKYSWVWNGLIV